ncbi:MAG: YhcN/YlaJ family sporulation lipoprotein [Clostridia bacterium]|nr:YhcN/YlaJ family sporulation lipoprotein [Clostridia bacterium]
MKKSMLLLLGVAATTIALTGCSMKQSGTTATAAPIVTNSPMPVNTTQAPMNTAMAPETSPASEDLGMNSGVNAANATTGAMNGATSGTANGAINGATNMASSMTPAQADRLAEQVEEAVERLSEVDDAEAVISNDRVLVAVEFDDQYSAGLDDRMKQMITEAVQKVDDGLKDIEITDDSTLYGQVKGLGERLAKATGLDELADDFGDLWDRITGR